MKVPLVDLASQEAVVAAQALDAIAGVAREATFVLGRRVAELEQWLAGACGAAHAVGVASGTDALELTLRALDVGPGDAVVTPAFSFVAAAEAIAAAGARPVFCDVDATTLNAAPEAAAEAFARAHARGLRVRAIVPVHLFGLCAPIDALAALARAEGVPLVEDAAQALGARDEAGHPPGSRADAACFSFFPTKSLGAWGDAGAVVTQNAALAERVRRLRVHGASAPYVHAERGRNSRLDALQAAVLLVKAPHVAPWQAARERLAARYLAELRRFPLVLPHAPGPPQAHAWHAFVVRTSRRDELATWLREHGVETRAYYPVPLHRQPCFAPLDEPALPVAEAACRTALALPVFPTMTDAQQSHVIECIERFFA
jgi:dTDP-4-amino-4,6-dideoxygalactose transaminase